jgi:hypothetical protein
MWLGQPVKIHKKNEQKANGCLTNRWNMRLNLLLVISRSNLRGGGGTNINNTELSNQCLIRILIRSHRVKLSKTQ